MSIGSVNNSFRAMTAPSTRLERNPWLFWSTRFAKCRTWVFSSLRTRSIPRRSRCRPCAGCSTFLSEVTLNFDKLAVFIFKLLPFDGPCVLSMNHFSQTMAPYWPLSGLPSFRCMRSRDTCPHCFLRIFGRALRRPAVMDVCHRGIAASYKLGFDYPVWCSNVVL